MKKIITLFFILSFSLFGEKCKQGYHKNIVFALGRSEQMYEGAYYFGYDKNVNMSKFDNNLDYALYRNVLEPMDWLAEFNYGVVKGKSICSETKGVYAKEGTPSNVQGNYCWCKMVGFLDDINSNLQHNEGSWVFAYAHGEGNPSNCFVDCPHYCARFTFNNENEFCSIVLKHFNIDVNKCPPCEPNDIKLIYNNKIVASCKYDSTFEMLPYIPYSVYKSNNKYLSTNVCNYDNLGVYEGIANITVECNNGYYFDNGICKACPSYRQYNKNIVSGISIGNKSSITDCRAINLYFEDEKGVGFYNTCFYSD